MAPARVQATDPGTLDYRWMTQDDGDGAWLLELYASWEEFLTHFQNVQDGGYLDSVMACFEIQAVSCLGDATPAAKEVLAGSGAVYYQQTAGFTRTATTAAH